MYDNVNVYTQNGLVVTWGHPIIKMSSYQYRKSHCGDKTVVRSSYLHNGISYTGNILNQAPEGISIWRCHLTKIGIPMLKIRWSCDCIIFNMGIPIPGNTFFIIRQGPESILSISLNTINMYTSMNIVSSQGTRSGYCWLNFLLLKLEYSGKIVAYDGCLYLVPQCHQQPWNLPCGINESLYPWGRISTTCCASLSENDRNANMFLCFQINTAWQELMM